MEIGATTNARAETFDALVKQYPTLEEFTCLAVGKRCSVVEIISSCPRMRKLITTCDDAPSVMEYAHSRAEVFADWDSVSKSFKPWQCK